MLATRMRISAGAAFYPYKINQSVRYNDDDSPSLYRTPVGAESSRTRWIWSSWMKRCNLPASDCHIFSVDQGSGWFRAWYRGATDHYIRIQEYDGAATRWMMYTNGLFRDVTSWYHILISFDSTDATTVDRLKLYTNGLEASFIWSSGISPNLESYVGTNDGHYIGSDENGTGEFDGYIAEPILVMQKSIQNGDYAITDFGKSKYGIWIPKRYTGSYGTNGFKLDFADENDLGNDVSGNNNDFTSSGLTSDDQVEDSPTNNYCVLNKLDNRTQAFVLSNGNLTAYSSSGYDIIRGTLHVTSGKWYWEVTTDDLSSGFLGICDVDDSGTGGVTADACVVRCSSGDKKTNGALTTYGAIIANGSVVMFALDMDNEEFYVGKDGNWCDGAGAWNQAFSTAISALSTISLPVAPAITLYDGDDASVNFGQLGFTYTPPTGYKALCSKNLPTPSVKNSSKGFDTILYEGNATVRDITDLNFDISAGGLVWIKNRDAADEHKLIDTVRGATKELSSNSNVVEGTDTNGLTAFLTNGFSLGTGANGYNDNNESFVAWCFRMGAKYGFDVQTYTGTGVAHAENHNLGGAPELMDIKNLDSVASWAVYHHHALNKTDPETDYGILDTVAAWADNVNRWNDTKPTSTQFTVGIGAAVNENTKSHVAYLWRSIEGFSKVFSYTGNNNADGPFVYCGFRPRYIMIKSSNNGTVGWVLYDTERDTYNVCSHRLFADAIAVEGIDANTMDILSNGFKLRSSIGRTNSALNYVGIAYAEQPGKWSNAR